ncbi:MAG: hypothetical protein QS748_12620 [Candidatus Endonucleobacter bathymodioli]|uniref:Ankyrin repeats (3 copies) n=1 Tax=Candidatus Endonucleibacter bathymodioli TaxID=539814 RepID=A0AA90NVB2_9GAMM|nr:hypothetical protein [Candidatus Endonucleobacter bathymodioli]
MKKICLSLILPLSIMSSFTIEVEAGITDDNTCQNTISEPDLPLQASGTTTQAVDVDHIFNATTDINKYFIDGQTYLHYCVKNLYPSFINLACRAVRDIDVNVNITNDSGDTPLHIAAQLTFKQSPDKISPLAISAINEIEELVDETSMDEMTTYARSKRPDCTSLNSEKVLCTFKIFSLISILARTIPTEMAAEEKQKIFSSALDMIDNTHAADNFKEKKNTLINLLSSLGANPTLKNNEGKTPRDLLHEQEYENYDQAFRCHNNDSRS